MSRDVKLGFVDFVIEELANLVERLENVSEKLDRLTDRGKDLLLRFYEPVGNCPRFERGSVQPSRGA